MEWLADFGVLDFDAAVARTHARIWAELETQGSLIGPHDLQIAATAIHHGHTVATDFSRPGHTANPHFAAIFSRIHYMAPFSFPNLAVD